MTTGRIDTDSDQSEKYKLDMDDPATRALYEERLTEWHKRLEPMTDAIRRARKITGDDLNIRVGPCTDLGD